MLNLKHGCAALALAALVGCAASEYDSWVSLGAMDEPIKATPVILGEEDWTFAGRSGLIIRTPHYRIFTTEKDIRLRERAPKFLEHALAHYRTAVITLPPPPQKLDTYLMDNRPQWETVTQRLMGEAADDLVQIQRGGYASRGIGVFYDLGVYDTLAIAAHEGWHQYTQRTFRDPLPVWLEEGMAVFMEGHRWGVREPRFLPWANTERFDRLRELVIDNRLVDLPTLLEMKPNDYLEDVTGQLLDFYAQAWAVTHFLNEGENGRFRPGFGRLLRDASTGEMRVVLEDRFGPAEAARALSSRRGDWAFRAYIGEDVAGLSEAYERFCREIVQTGSREAIAVGRSPLERQVRK